MLKVYRVTLDTRRSSLLSKPLLICLALVGAIGLAEEANLTTVTYPACLYDVHGQPLSLFYVQCSTRV